MGAPSALYWLVQPDVPGCPLPLIDRAIIVAAREWCDLTQTAVEVLAVSSANGQQSYPLTLSSLDLDIARITGVTYGAYDLGPMTGNTSQAKLDAQGGAPGFFWLEGTTLWLDRVPQSVVSLAVSVAVKPKVGAATLPDALVSGDPGLAIGARAKSALMMSKQSWGDPALGAWNESEFQRMARNAINLNGRNGTNAPLRVTSVP